MPKIFSSKIVSAILLACLIVLLSYWLSSRPRYCRSPLCRKSAEMLLASMNTSVDPCEDFYEFACGSHAQHVDKYSEHHEIAKKFILENISNYLETKTNPREPRTLMQAKTLYKQCMDTLNRQNETFDQIAQVLEQVGLPVLPPLRGPSSNFSFIKSLVRSKLIYNMDFFFKFSVALDSQNSPRIMMFLSKPDDEPPLASPYKTSKRHSKYRIKKFMEKIIYQLYSVVENNPLVSATTNEYRTAFHEYAQNVTRFVHDYLNMPRSTSIDSTFDELMNTDLYLKKLMTMHFSYDSVSKSRPDSRVSVGVLQKITDRIWSKNSNVPKVDWKKYFTMFLKDKHKTKLKFKDVGKDTEIGISDKYYTAWILYWLANRATLRQIEMYMWWTTVTNIAPFTSTEIRTYTRRFWKEGFDYVDMEPRNLWCADMVNNVLPHATALMLVNSSDAIRDIRMVRNMVDDIRVTFQRSIQNADWMDQPMKNAAIKKLKNVKSCIGIPSWLRRPQELDAYYEQYGYVEINLDDNNILTNLLKLAQAKHRMEKSLLEIEHYDGDDEYERGCDFKPLEVNAFNYLTENRIVIPAGWLQFPYYGHDLPSLNYATIGSTIAHELGHCFDSTGIDYDDRGNLWNPLWSNITKMEYFRRMECLVKHYDNFTEPGYLSKQSPETEFYIGEPPEEFRQMNWTSYLVVTKGRRTLDENFADVCGLQNAFRAYRTYLEKNKPELLLIGLEHYSTQQLFFLAYAHDECARNYRSESYIQATDTHSTHRMRVWGVLTNSEEFAQTWKCKKGTPMNPVGEKCEVW